MSRSTAETDPIGIVGLGRVGSHAARQLRSEPWPLVVFDRDRETRARVLGALRPVDSIGEPNGSPARTVILATMAGDHGRFAAPLVRSGVSVISTSDDPADVTELLNLDAAAKDSGATVVAGAGMSPGISCLHAAHAARHFSDVHEASIWTTGTAGPACARRHHRSLQTPGQVLIDGQWVEKRGGSGRDLTWFPGDLGARDCYRGALAEPILLRRLFPNSDRLSARTSATRRDRVTGSLPMLRRPHPDGGPGGVRIEVRGLAEDGYRTEVVGVNGFPSVIAATVAAVVAIVVHSGAAPAGAVGVSEVDRPERLLAELHRRGITAARFGA